MQVSFSMAIEKEQFMHVCFSKHFRMGTARIENDKETEEGKKKRAKMEGSSRKAVVDGVEM